MNEFDDDPGDINVTEEQEQLHVGSVPSHLRRRYWSSWEELKLVELWRHRSTEVTTTLKHIPIFTTMSLEMRKYGFQVNSQECRRKINNIRKRYEALQSHAGQTGTEVNTDWKLYPLVHLILSPQKNTTNLHHEENIIKNFLNELPTLAEPYEKLIPITDKSELVHKDVALYKRFSSMMRNEATYPTAGIRMNRPPLYKAPKCNYQSLLHLKISHINELQQDNHRLEEQRKDAKKRLFIEERELQMLERILQRLQGGGEG